MEAGPLKLTAPELAQADVLGLRFLAEFYATEVARRPENLGAWLELGHLYTRLGRHAEGLAADREIVRRMPDDATAHYNLACSHALLAQHDDALHSLARAIELGYDDREHLLADEDLAGLRDDPRFRALADGLRSDAS